MNFKDRTLTEVAAATATHLKHIGVNVVVVGGSAITIHVPEVYTSYDIDFAVTTGIDKPRITAALDDLGFKLNGRTYVNPTTTYTVDIVANTPYIDDRPIHDYAHIATNVGEVQVLHLEDAIADRIAAFLYWNDSQSLDVAERAVASAYKTLRWDRLEEALKQLDSRGAKFTARFDLALKNLRRSYKKARKDSRAQQFTAD